MGWLTDKLNQVAKIDPIGDKIVTTVMKQDSKVVKGFADAVGWRSLSSQAQSNIDDPRRGIGRAATATAAAYLGWLGMGGGAGGAAGGGVSAGTVAQYGGLALNAYQALAARNAARNAPNVRSPIHMPSPEETAAARRRKTAEIMRRSGRASTILSDSETLG